MPNDTFSFGVTAAATIADRALCTVFNAETSDPRRQLELVSLTVRETPFPPTMASSLVGTLEAVRINGLTGGVATPVVPTNSSATLPTAVRCLTQVDLIDGAAPLRAFWLNQPGFGSTSTSPVPWLATSGGKNPGQPCRNPGVLWHAGYGSLLQRLELREGEGIAIRPAATSPAPQAWLCEVEFEIGGATFLAPCELTPVEGQAAAVALFNGSGSGVVVAVRAMQVSPAGFHSYDNPATTPASESSTLRLVRVRRATGGLVVDPLPASTASEPPIALQIRRGSLRAELTVQLADGLDPAGDLGYPSTNAAAVRRLNAMRGLRMRVASLDLATGFTEGNFVTARSLRQGWENHADLPVQGLVLRPQEGIALLANTASPLCSYVIEGTILHRPPPTAITAGRRPVARVLGA
jgi:hypothetical protein